MNHVFLYFIISPESMKQHVRGNLHKFIRIRLAKLHTAVVPIRRPATDNVAKKHYLDFMHSFRQCSRTVMPRKTFNLSAIVHQKFTDRKSTRLNTTHRSLSRMPSSA